MHDSLYACGKATDKTPEEIIGKDVIAKLIDIGVKSFGNGMEDKEVRDHIIYGNDFVTVAYDENGSPIGFAGLRIDDGSLYLSAAVVDINFQGEGVYKEMTKFRIAVGGLDEGKEVRTRTQNPKVEEGILSALKTFAKDRKITVTRDRINGAYGRCLTGERQKTRDEDLNKIYEQLDVNRGDAFVLHFKLVKR